MAKQTFSVQCRDQEGELYSVKVPADSEDDAKALAARQGNLVEGSGKKWAGQIGPRAKYLPGESLAVAGNIFGIMGLVLLPCSAAALILGACARERSSGERGGTAMTLGGIGLVLSILVATLLVIVAKAQNDSAARDALIRSYR